MTPESADSARLFVASPIDGTLYVLADLVMSTPALASQGLISLPFIYLPQQGDRGPLAAYVAVEDAVHWLERLGSAGCAGCDGDGTAALLEHLRTRYARHLAGDSKEGA
jgi:hypothetical protein